MCLLLTGRPYSGSNRAMFQGLHLTCTWQRCIAESVAISLTSRSPSGLQALTIDRSFKLVPCCAYQLCNVAVAPGSFHPATVGRLQHAFCRRGVNSASAGDVYSMSDLKPVISF